MGKGRSFLPFQLASTSMGVWVGRASPGNFGVLGGLSPFRKLEGGLVWRSPPRKVDRFFAPCRKLGRVCKLGTSPPFCTFVFSFSFWFDSNAVYHMDRSMDTYVNDRRKSVLELSQELTEPGDALPAHHRIAFNSQ